MTRLCTLLVLFLLRCGTDTASLTAGAEAGALTDACTTETWERFGRGFFASHCIACHWQLRSHAAVVEEQTVIRAQIASGNMPKDRPLTSDEKRAVLSFLDCAASPTDNTTTPSDPSAADSGPAATSTSASASTAPRAGSTVVSPPNAAPTAPTARTAPTAPTSPPATDAMTATSPPPPPSGASGPTAATAPPDPAPDTPPCTTETYATVGPMFSICTSCHSFARTQAGLQSVAAVAASELQSGAMPLGSSLASADRDRMVQWLSCGAP
jgi:hypothetical protein